MTIFIELTTSPIVEQQARVQEQTPVGARAGIRNARRPLRGTEIKEDTYAMIKVIDAAGRELPLVDSGTQTGVGLKTSNFILQSVQESRMEKHQIVETFGEPFMFMFGESPRFIDCGALLINSLDFNWEAEWWRNWETKLRGSRSLELGARTYLFFDDSILSGFMLMAQATKQSDQPFIVQLTWKMWVCSHRNVSFVGDPNFPVQASVSLPPNVSLTSGDAFSSLVQTYQSQSRSELEQQAYSDEINRQAEGTNAGSFGSRSRLTDTLRNSQRAFAFPVSVQNFIDTMRATNAQDFPGEDIINRFNSRPLRSKIVDNIDEFTGAGNLGNDLNADTGFATLPGALEPRARTLQESTDLFYDAISWMSLFGANINSYSALYGLGLGVNFGRSAGIGIGLGASIGGGIGGGATFAATASAGVGFGGSAGAGLGFGANGGLGFSSGAVADARVFGSANASAGLRANGFAGAQLGRNAFAQAALFDDTDVFFGGGSAVRTGQAQVLAARRNNSLNLGFGDPTYGYDSPFGGVGFNKAGFGDYGGRGYGSAFGEFGDPGHIAPDAFTFAGVEDDRSAFERFVVPRPGFGSGFGGVGAGDSFAGPGIGASVSVTGSITAFSTTVTEGTLDLTGQQSRPDTIITRSVFASASVDETGTFRTQFSDEQLQVAATPQELFSGTPNTVRMSSGVPVVRRGLDRRDLYRDRFRSSPVVGGISVQAGVDSGGFFSETRSSGFFSDL